MDSVRVEFLDGQAPSSVEFATSLGRFVGSGTPAGMAVIPINRGAAVAWFEAGSSPGTAVVSARAAGRTVRTTIRLVPAGPDSIALGTNRAEAPADGKTAVEVVALLLRSKGAVTKGVPVRFTVTSSATGQQIPGLEATVRINDVSAAKWSFTSLAPMDIEVTARVGEISASIPLSFRSTGG